jgi:hypothetical protein
LPVESDAPNPGLTSALKPPLREMRTLGRCTKATKRPYGLKLVLFEEIFNDPWRRTACVLGEIAQSGVP